MRVGRADNVIAIITKIKIPMAKICEVTNFNLLVIENYCSFLLLQQVICSTHVNEMAGNLKTCVVIGAGVVGLSTAICLQNKGYSVTIIADRFGVDTTSHVAAGIFIPYNKNVLGEKRQHETIDAIRRSWKHYSKLGDSSAENTGVIKCFGYHCFFTKSKYCEPIPEESLGWWDFVERYRSLSEEELRRMMPESPCTGWVVQTYIIQCQFYLPYLMRQFKAHGGKLLEKHLNSFDEIPPCDVIVNCCGLGAAKLCGDNSMYPIQGQIAHIRAPQVKYFFHCQEWYPPDGGQKKLLNLFPLTNHAYIGSTYNKHSDKKLVDEDVTKKRINQLSHVFPTIQDCEIIKEECGLRPGRDSIRLEVEKITLSGNRVVNVVHNYGHGGDGVALSWGTAGLAADMVSRLLHPSRL